MWTLSRRLPLMHCRWLHAQFDAALSSRCYRGGSKKGRIMRCENAEVLTDGRLVSPSAERNKGPIVEVLARALPENGTVLEVSSGTGQHIVHFARAMPHLVWQPTERDPDTRRGRLFASRSLWRAADEIEARQTHRAQQVLSSYVTPAAEGSEAGCNLIRRTMYSTTR